MSFLKHLLIAPCLGSVTFILVLPYMVLAFLAAQFVGGIEWSEEFKRGAADLFDALPSRRGRTRDPMDPERIPQVIGFLTALFVGMLVVWRASRVSARLSGLPSASMPLALILPDRYWLGIAAPFMVLVALILIATSLANDQLVLIDGTGINVPVVYSRALFSEFALAYLVIGLIFALFGVTLVRRALGFLEPKTFATGFFAILIASFLLAAMVIFIQPFLLILVLRGLEALGLINLTISARVQVSAHALLFWCFISCFCAQVLKDKVRQPQ